MRFEAKTGDIDTKTAPVKHLHLVINIFNQSSWR